jgi:CheY-like chemotaxis protein
MARHAFEDLLHHVHVLLVLTNPRRREELAFALRTCSAFVTATESAVRARARAGVLAPDVALIEVGDVTPEVAELVHDLAGGPEREGRPPLIVALDPSPSFDRRGAMLSAGFSEVLPLAIDGRILCMVVGHRLGRDLAEDV